MITWTIILAIFNFLLALIGPFGVALALRGNKLHEEQLMAERVRNMYEEENKLLQTRVERLELDNRHLNKMQNMIIEILQRVKGIELKIDDSMVILRDKTGTQVVQHLSDTGPLQAV